MVATSVMRTMNAKLVEPFSDIVIFPLLGDPGVLPRRGITRQATQDAAQSSHADDRRTSLEVVLVVLRSIPEDRLEEVARQLGQLRSFALGQIDVGVDALPLHLVDEIAKPIGVAVQVGVVDLEDVAGEDQLGAVARAGDDGLNLMQFSSPSSA